MRIRLAIPDDIVGADTIAAALEAATIANQALARRGRLPDLDRALRTGSVKWRPESFRDGEHFDLAPEVLRRGWGDCDDLAPWLAAQLREDGEDAMPIAIKSGPKTWHAVVEREDGTILDPSKWAGMGMAGGKHGVAGTTHGQINPPGWSSIALAPHPRGGWGARADLATEGDDHLTCSSWDRDPRRALQRAIVGWMAAGEGMAAEGHSVGFSFSDVVDTVVPIAVDVAVPGAGVVATDAIKTYNQSAGPAGLDTPAGKLHFDPQTAKWVLDPPKPPAASSPKIQTVPLPPPKDSSREGRLSYCPGGGPIIVRFL